MSHTTAAADVPLAFDAPSEIHDNELFEPAPTAAKITDGAAAALAAAVAQPPVALSPVAAFWAAAPPPVWGQPKGAPAADDVVTPPSPAQQLTLVCTDHDVPGMPASLPNCCIRSQ